MSNYKMRSTRPEKVFLCDQVIRQASVLDAAIIGELYYWIAKGEKPWRKADDFAELFRVNEGTIRDHFDLLADKYRYLSKNRTRLQNGRFGSYQFRANNTSNSKRLVSIYTGILNNSSIKNDFGEFDPYETDYKEVPSTQLILSDSIELTKCITTAYMLDRICWALIARQQDELYFDSKAHLSRWSGIEYKTACRRLDKLKNIGLADFKDESDQLVVWANACSSLEFFEQYMKEKHEKRVENLPEFG